MREHMSKGDWPMLIRPAQFPPVSAVELPDVQSLRSDSDDFAQPLRPRSQIRVPQDAPKISSGLGAANEQTNETIAGMAQVTLEKSRSDVK